MSHTAIIFSFLFSVVYADNWLDIIRSKVPISCRSRFQIERDITQFQNCTRDDTRIFKEYPTLEVPVNKFCEGDLTLCYKTLAETLKHCLDEENYTEVFGNTLNAVGGGLEYACSYKGQPLQDFMDNAWPCSKIHPNIDIKIDECLRKPLPKGLTISFSSEEACSFLIRLSQCLIDATNICDNKTPRDFLKNLSLNMLNQTPCKNFTHQLYVYTPATLIAAPTKSPAPILTINVLVLAIFAFSIIMFNNAM
uniref:DUF19 domain-containing protein n=1 Tax=Strigamia maritima TaxID=126957 RepID=T1J5L5_STRMM